MAALVSLGSGEITEPVESIIYSEGIGLDGYEVSPDREFPAVIVDGADNIMIDWSDNIVFHKFPAGQKIRTEVILHHLDGINDPAVYTLTAHLKIENINGLGGVPVGDDLYWSSIGQGVFIAEGPNDYYSAEVNEMGLLLYGYNWDTSELDPGWYRLTFWLEKDYTCPDINPLTGNKIVYKPVSITSHASGDTDETNGTIYGVVSDNFRANTFSIDIELMPKPNGR